ncbi:hypothetical protein HD806DRAFT_506729, partial [Xylariaceae sp. AK1471]
MPPKITFPFLSLMTLCKPQTRVFDLYGGMKQFLHVCDRVETGNLKCNAALPRSSGRVTVIYSLHVWLS